MKGYGVLRRHRCCPGHDQDSKKFDRHNRHTRWKTFSLLAFYRAIKRRARQEGKVEIEKEKP